MKRRAGRGALVIIALLFASSGALRIGEEFGSALAEAAKEGETPDASHEAVEPSGHEDAGSAGTEVAMAEGTCPPLPAALAASLSEREARLAAAEAAVADREAAMDLAEVAITARLEEMKAAEESLRKTLAIADEAAEKDIVRLVTVYETMKPKDAAALFDAMEADFAAGFLVRMRPDAAAAVLAGMTPEKAYAVSAIMAGRNASAPKE